MSTRHLKRSPLLRSVIIGILIAELSIINPVWAGPNPPGSHEGYPNPGRIFDQIQGNHHTVRSGKDQFIFNEGIFYHRDPKGFRVVRPPRGIVVDYLPIGFETLIIAGITYFLFAGIYYQKTDSGYVVVDTPQAEPAPQVQTPDTSGKTLVVNVNLLNVRIGPSMDHTVIDQVGMGDHLVIEGSSSGWYYVRLPNGNFGWVMSQYTRKLLPDAKG